ncbi:hypothetical protein LTS10_005369 [Elasticomyces elasticus]|nr:hypothetical protein LTS10_005369 [Elasticomyces elasticus]
MSEEDNSFRKGLAEWVTFRDTATIWADSLARLFETGKLVDFEIACGQHVFKVHKVVICAQSKYFLAPCGKDYAEGSNGRITFKAIDEEGGDASCDDPEAIKHMVHFFYYSDYTAENIKTSSAVTPEIPPPEVPYDPWAKSRWGGPVGTKTTKKRGDARYFADAETPPQKHKAKPTSGSANGNTVVHAKVFAAAVKYDVPALQKLASAKFAAAASSDWNHDTFADAVRIAYTTTPDNIRALRDIVCETIHSHPSLLDKASVMSAAEDSHLLGEVVRMAYNMPAIPEGDPIDQEAKCDNCGNFFWYRQCSQCSSEYNACCGKRCVHGCVTEDED